jgi:hypothetical protein
LYENQDGWLCLCFEPEETPHQRANEQDGDYVRVQSTYTVWAPGRTELFNQYLGVLREIPRLIAPPPPEVEEMHRETGYDS